MYRIAFQSGPFQGKRLLILRFDQEGGLSAYLKGGAGGQGFVKKEADFCVLLESLGDLRYIIH